MPKRKVAPLDPGLQIQNGLERFANKLTEEDFRELKFAGGEKKVELLRKWAPALLPSSLSDQKVKENRSKIAREAVEGLLVCEALAGLPPKELIALVAKLLRVDSRPRSESRDPRKKSKAAKFLSKHPDASIREVARKSGVSPNTVKAWREDPEFQRLVAWHRNYPKWRREMKAVISATLGTGSEKQMRELAQALHSTDSGLYPAVSETEMKVLVLLSGGIDSSCCVALYRRMGYDVTGVFVDYGQPVNQKEEQSAKAIADHYVIPLHIIRCSGPSPELQGEIPGRNAFLVFVALLYHPTFAGLLALRIHAGTTYYECSEYFATQVRTILPGYGAGQIVLATPFLLWTKLMVCHFGVEQKLPIQFTWSCEVGPSEPCGRCLSCKDREHLNVRTPE